MPSRRCRPFAVLAAACLVLGGCLSTPITSLPRLMRLDLATMDMREVRAGLRLPSMLRVRPGDAVMTVRLRPDGGQPSDETFVLVETTEDSERAALAAEARSGHALSIWRIAPEDLGRIAAIQQRVRDSLVRGPRVRGGLEVRIAGGCRTAPVPAGPVSMSSYLKPGRDESYITLVADLDLRRFIALRDWDQKIPACGA